MSKSASEQAKSFGIDISILDLIIRANSDLLYKIFLFTYSNINEISKISNRFDK